MRERLAQDPTIAAAALGATVALRESRMENTHAHLALDTYDVPRVRTVSLVSITSADVRKLQPRTTSEAYTVHAALHHVSDLVALEKCVAMFNALPESDRLLTLAERIQWLAARNGARQ